MLKKSGEKKKDVKISTYELRITFFCSSLLEYYTRNIIFTVDYCQYKTLISNQLFLICIIRLFGWEGMAPCPLLRLRHRFYFAILRINVRSFIMHTSPFEAYVCKCMFSFLSSFDNELKYFSYKSREFCMVKCNLGI